LSYEKVTASDRPEVFLIEDDMSTGYLVRFILRGEKASCYVHVEISNQLPKGIPRYVYLQNLSDQNWYLWFDFRNLHNRCGKWNSCFKVIYLPIARIVKDIATQANELYDKTARRLAKEKRKMFVVYLI
jgi:hypothetical protein